jgi:hypothetical protein
MKRDKGDELRPGVSLFQENVSALKQVASTLQRGVLWFEPGKTGTAGK